MMMKGIVLALSVFGIANCFVISNNNIDEFSIVDSGIYDNIMHSMDMFSHLLQQPSFADKKFAKDFLKNITEVKSVFGPSFSSATPEVLLTKIDNLEIDSEELVKQILRHVKSMLVDTHPQVKLIKRDVSEEHESEERENEEHEDDEVNNLMQDIHTAVSQSEEKKSAVHRFVNHLEEGTKHLGKIANSSTTRKIYTYGCKLAGIDVRNSDTSTVKSNLKKKLCTENNFNKVTKAITNAHSAIVKAKSFLNSKNMEHFTSMWNAIKKKKN